ncbi:MAG: DUF4139 domain-containing protein [Treponema sp.]|nr:DUF4139 domain-containing protein [Treponema sp.]
MQNKKKPIDRSCSGRRYGIAATLMALAGIIFSSGLYAQAIRDSAGSQSQDAPPALKRIVIFSSGLSYFEHSGNFSGNVVFNLPFQTSSVNDALKSLVINDPASSNPQIRYQSEQTLIQTLRSLSIDLSGSPEIADILAALRGEEVEIAAPSAVSGRIIGIERRYSFSPVSGQSNEAWLSLSTGKGIQLFNLKEISSIAFKNDTINNDLKRALDLIAASRQQDSRDLTVSLPGAGSRQISLSYVIPSPVWKVSYRLDLGNTAQGAPAAKPLLQGWAIIDNDSDTDWNNVTLSLVAGRPVSFIQNLYPPYYVTRPVLPLAIAGTAAAETYESPILSSAGSMDAAKISARSMFGAQAMADTAISENASMPMAAPAPSVSGGTLQGAQGQAAGDQFEFTIKSPVSLERRMSAMLPLVESAVDARKTLIFSGLNPIGQDIHPKLGAELTNTSGMKLPAGPITVYEDGTYAGDALIEFWNEGEKRLISWGEDLSVTGNISMTTTRVIRSVAISGGVMTISRSQDFYKTYTFSNMSAQPKSLLIEHPKTQGTELKAPEADDETASAYRFTMIVQPQTGLIVTVNESRILSEQVGLTSLRPEILLSYATNQEIPARVRTALSKAIDLKRAADAAQAAVTLASDKRDNLISEQDRIRKNLEAAGGQTQQGQEYLKRLADMDANIDQQGVELQNAQTAAQAAQDAYQKYLDELKL